MLLFISWLSIILFIWKQTKLLPSVTEDCYYSNPSTRWSTSMPTRFLLWEQGTSVLLASTPRRPCTQASASSATPWPTGKSSPSPSAASSTAPPSSWATTGRSRVPPPPSFHIPPRTRAPLQRPCVCL